MPFQPNFLFLGMQHATMKMQIVAGCWTDARKFNALFTMKTCFSLIDSRGLPDLGRGVQRFEGVVL